MEISVRSNLNDAIRDIDEKRTNLYKAVPRALNKTANQGRTAASKSIRQDVGYNIKAAVIKAAMSIWQANASTWASRVQAKGKAIPLIDFDAKPNTITRPLPKRGVSVKVMRARTTVHGSFIANVNGKIRLCIRAPGAKHITKVISGRKISTAVPIWVLYGPGVSTAFRNAIVQRATRERMQQQFPPNLARELKYATTTDAGDDE